MEVPQEVLWQQPLLQLLLQPGRKGRVQQAAVEWANRV
jgi:hypothetical protein